jgi:hypothetical protein
LDLKTKIQAEVVFGKLPHKNDWCVGSENTKYGLLMGAESILGGCRHYYSM